MAFEIPQLYTEMFNLNIRTVAQQNKSRLAETVTSESQSTEVEYIDEIQPIELVRKTARNASTPLDPAIYYRRASFLQDWHRGVPVKDPSDTIRMSMRDPTWAVTGQLASARNRCRDTNIIRIALGTVQRRDEERESFDQIDIPASNRVAVNYVSSGTPVNSNLTIAKLIKMRSILGLSEDDALATGAPEIYFVHSQRQIDSLLLYAEQVSNNLYAEVRALMDGKIHYFMGFKFVQTELLPVVNGIRTCMAYTKDTILEKVGMNDFSRVDIREDKSYITQAYTMVSYGGVRRQEKTIVTCQCDEN